MNKMSVTLIVICVVSGPVFQFGCVTQCRTKETGPNNHTQANNAFPSDEEIDATLEYLKDLGEKKRNLIRQLDSLKLQLVEYRSAKTDQAAKRQADSVYPKAEYYEGLKRVEAHLSKEIGALRAEYQYYQTLLTTDVLKPKEKSREPQR